MHFRHSVLPEDTERSLPIMAGVMGYFTSPFPSKVRPLCLGVLHLMTYHFDRLRPCSKDTLEIVLPIGLICGLIKHVKVIITNYLKQFMLPRHDVLGLVQLHHPRQKHAIDDKT